MLHKLTIKNYGLLEQVQMKPAEGLTLLTGATGAGKSTVLSALRFLGGARTDTQILAPGAQNCVVEGHFQASPPMLQVLWAQHDVEPEDSLIIRRELHQSGRSRSFINDSPVSLKALKAFTQTLLHFHNQHDTLQLHEQSHLLDMLDAYAGNQALRQQYYATYVQYQQAKKVYQESLARHTEDQKNQDYHRFLYQELLEANLKPGEEEQLTARLRLAQNLHKVQALLHESDQYLQESPSSTLEQLKHALQACKQLSDLQPNYQSYGERLTSCLIELEDIAVSLKQAAHQLEEPSESVADMESRLSLFYRLQQKHKAATLDDLIQVQYQLATTCQGAAEREQQLQQAEQDFRRLEQQAREAADVLTQHRVSQLDAFTQRLTELLKRVGMPNAQVQLIHQPTQLTPSGQDEVSMLFSANKGIPAQPLQQVASGGELSRLMLCLKFMISDQQQLPTLVFDEIDAGISGAIALQVGAMMQQMAKKHQLLVVTHLPQIAAQQGLHYHVHKQEDQQKTTAAVAQLSESARLAYLAELLGESPPSSAALEAAQALLQATHN